MNYPVQFLPGDDGKFRWHLLAPNQAAPAKVIAIGGQGYSTKSNARRAWRRTEAIITAGLAVERP